MKTRKKVQKLMHGASRRRSVFPVAIIIFALAGTIALINSFAATPTASFEPEDGVLSGALTLLDSNPNASGGEFIRFDTPSTGGTTSWPVSNVKAALGFASPSSSSLTTTENWLGRKTNYWVRYSVARKGTPAQSLNGFKSSTGGVDGRTVIMSIPMAYDPEVRNSQGVVTYTGGCAGWNAAQHRTILRKLVDRNPDNSTKEAGSDDSLWEGIGQYIKDTPALQGTYADGRPKLILRLGWESNGDWYCWSTKGDSSTGGTHLGTEFRNAYRHIHDLVEAKAGMDLTWAYGINAGPGSPHAAAQQAYPGNDYVDIVELDVYDTSSKYWANGVTVPNLDKFTDAWQEKANSLNPIRDESLWSSKPIAVGEWGNWHERNKSTDAWVREGGGDNPKWVQAMHDWLEPIALQRRIAYQVQFDYNVDLGTNMSYHKLSNSSTRNPNSAAKFLQLFR